MTGRALFLPQLASALGEAQELLRQASDYVAWVLAQVSPLASRAEVLHECCRITVRVTGAMSWLLAQKAVALGEADGGPGDISPCLLTAAYASLDLAGDTAGDGLFLSARLAAISRRSTLLFRRVLSFESALGAPVKA